MPLLKGFNTALIFLSKKPLLFLGPAWLLMQLFLYQWHGIQIVYDSKRYFAYSASISSENSFWLQPDSIFYASYTLLIYFFLEILSLPVTSIIASQIIIAGLATLCLYNFVLNLTHSRLTAFICLCLFILWPDIHSWNLYIHTESLYVSITIIVLYIISQKSVSHYKLGFLFILLMFALFLRPNGFFLSIGVVGSTFIGIKYNKAKRYKVSILLSLTLAVFVFTYLLNEALEIFSPLDYLRQGQIIQGYNGLTIPIQLAEANYSASVLNQILYTLITQPLACINLLLMRFLFFWGQIRPYYSVIHNILLLIYFLPVYTFAILAIKKIKHLQKAYIFMITVAFLQTVMAMIISVDWDNRFVVPVLSFAFVFASIGLTTLFSSSHAKANS